MYKKTTGIILLLLLVSTASSVDKLALTMKTKGDVQRQAIETGVLELLKRGSALYDGDKVITGDDGLAIILFLDDKTQLKLKGNSETEINGTLDKRGISKRINMTYGTLKASIAKQKGEFTVSTPTSVASVKGTEFWLITSSNPGDIFINISGTVVLTNNFSRRSITTGPGDVVQSTPEGELNVLTTVKIQGQATTGISGGQFNITNISIIDGDVETGDLSGIIRVENNTIFEGAEVESGLTMTVTGIFDDETGNVTASLIEVATPITIEATASSSISANEFSISDVTLVEGNVESMPNTVKITESTVIEGGDVIAGAHVTVTGNYNEETGAIEASQIIVVIPELKISGYVSTIISESEIEISSIEVILGDVDPSAMSGKVTITEGTVFEGGELAVGAKVTVSGTFDEASGNIIASRIVVAQVVILAVANSAIINDQFEVTDISVLEGDVDPSNLSGIVRLTADTEIEGGDVAPGMQVTVTGSFDEGTGDIIAIKIVVIVAERELLFELEDNQGNRKELIIKFQ